MRRKLTSTIRDLNFKGSGKMAFYLGKLFFGKPKKKCIVTTIYDFKLHIDPVKDNGVEKSIYYYGTYEKGTLAILGKLLKEGDIFIDVGANIGLFSIYASSKVGKKGKVIAFEPNPETRAILKTNVDLHTIQNITIEAVALSDVTKEGKIYDRWEVNRGAASLIAPNNPTDFHAIQEVQFSDYFSKEQQIKLIKIDVEGYELNVIKGTKFYMENCISKPSLIVEFSSHRANTFGKDINNLFLFLKNLRIYRFFVSALGKERLSKLIEITNAEDLPEHDNVFCLTEEHIQELPKKVFQKVHLS